VNEVKVVVKGNRVVVLKNKTNNTLNPITVLFIFVATNIYLVTVTTGVRILFNILAYSEEKAENFATPKKGSATRKLTGCWTLSNDD
jgi:hypothetical protein